MIGYKKKTGSQKTWGIVTCYSFFIFLFYWLTCFSTVVYATPIGTMDLNKGKVVIHGQGDDRIYKGEEKGIEIYEKDEIHSGDQSRVSISLQNKNEVIELYSNSYLIISQIREQGSELSLPIGKARFAVKRTFQIKKKIRRRFRIRTVNSIIGVKGTNFMVQVLKNITSVMTLEGIVSLANLGEIDKIVDVAKNMASRTVGTIIPTKPIAVPQKQRQKILLQDSAENWEGLGFKDIKKDSNRGETNEESPEDVGKEVLKIRSIVNQSNAIREGAKTNIKFKVTND